MVDMLTNECSPQVFMSVALNISIFYILCGFIVNKFGYG